MKCINSKSTHGILMSLPVREVWIEICFHFPTDVLSLPVREVWIEISDTMADTTKDRMSLPVREVWIEMHCPMVFIPAHSGHFP